MRRSHASRTDICQATARRDILRQFLITFWNDCRRESLQSGRGKDRKGWSIGYRRRLFQCSEVGKGSWPLGVPRPHVLHKLGVAIGVGIQVYRKVVKGCWSFSTVKETVVRIVRA